MMTDCWGVVGAAMAGKARRMREVEAMRKRMFG
jgi:hypothetical protein